MCASLAGLEAYPGPDGNGYQSPSGTSYGALAASRADEALAEYDQRFDAKGKER
jgi:hypothetical protein